MAVSETQPHIYHVGRAIPSEQKHLELKEQSNIVGPTMPVPELSQKEVGNLASTVCLLSAPNSDLLATTSLMLQTAEVIMLAELKQS